MPWRVCYLCLIGQVAHRSEGKGAVSSFLPLQVEEEFGELSLPLPISHVVPALTSLGNIISQTEFIASSEASFVTGFCDGRGAAI